MSTKENKALARHWFAEGWNKGNMTVADVIFSPRFMLNGIEVGIEDHTVSGEATLLQQLHTLLTSSKKT